jgi:TonB family protein
MLVDEGDDGFFARHRAKIIVAVFAALAGGAFFFMKSGKSASAPQRAPERMVSISLPPLPKPPPPPPPKVQPPPPKEEKMVQETAAEEKPKEAAPKPPEPAPAPLGTGVKGDGPGIAGLGSSGNGSGGFGGGGGGGGSKWGWYAGKVQARVAEALRRDSHTKSASMQVQVRIWPDNTGRITKAKLDRSTGDRNLDAELERVLTSIQLTEPPPTGLPLPIVMRLTARRPPQ